ncbi:hypothetical protein ACFQOY_03580 [Enterococcus alcedinis]|uniref:Uncharacterized protein n=1 Tax=Enterococcus alcedinis TaxID=1274384 RepID=A0A917N506_9ENTE|nr:hypothetical protein [Enterococcus alcedinis]MBP2102698.1 hypothetical protein [Enterococcus alcedinis]GGI66258.1 hypothetical protein GCM10011482_19120 [Enterococcus alcedinis]
MEEVNWLEVGLNSSSDLKVIMKGSVESNKTSDKIGVVSLIYVSSDVDKIKDVYKEVTESDPNGYYMVYGIDLDERLDLLAHYPSIAIERSDLD